MPAHKHAELMKQYAEDAMETDKPWERWEYLVTSLGDGWITLCSHPAWCHDHKYRRKPRTIRIGEYDVPEPVREVEDGAEVWLVYPAEPYQERANNRSVWFAQVLKAGLVHLDRESAELHYKAITSFTRAE